MAAENIYTPHRDDNFGQPAVWQKPLDLGPETHSPEFLLIAS